MSTDVDTNHPKPKGQTRMLKCAYCKWFDGSNPPDESTDGVCRLRPPVPLIVERNRVLWEFPSVSVDDYCSELELWG